MAGAKAYKLSTAEGVELDVGNRGKGEANALPKLAAGAER